MEIIYSIVIPFKNEEDNVKDLIDELEPVMNSQGMPWELICIDDGSVDNTKKVLQKLANEKKYLQLIIFDKNYGQSSAFDAGFKAAKGDYVITLDGDRQNDPADIPRMIQHMGDADLICGIRAKRKDTFSKRMISKMANFVRNKLCNDGIQDTGCSLKIYKKNALKEIKMFHGMHRFLPALFMMEGFKIVQTPVNHRERTKGQSNYNIFNRSFNTVADLLAVSWMQRRHLHYKIQSEQKSS